MFVVLTREGSAVNTAGFKSNDAGLGLFRHVVHCFFVFDVPSISDLLATFRFCYHCFTISKKRTQLLFCGVGAFLIGLKGAVATWLPSSVDGTQCSTEETQLPG